MKSLPSRYAEMLKMGIERGFVVSVTNFVDEFLCPVESVEARALPYQEGELWFDEAENIIGVCSPP